MPCIDQYSVAGHCGFDWATFAFHFWSEGPNPLIPMALHHNYHLLQSVARKNHGGTLPYFPEKCDDTPPYFAEKNDESLLNFAGKSDDIPRRRRERGGQKNTE